MNLFGRFNDIVGDPESYARQWKEATGSKVVGHMCTYTPEELIVAAGALPFRIFGTPSSVSAVDAHLQSYSCSIVRNALEDALTGKLAFLDGTVFPHTCDSFQRLADIWRRNTGLGFQLDLMLPVKLNTDSAQLYAAEVLSKFKRELERVLHIQMTDHALRNAISCCNQVRRLLGQLYDIKTRRPGSVSIKDVHTAFKAAMVMEKNEFIHETSGILDVLASTDDTGVSVTKPVVVTGGACLVPEVLHIIEESGATVVGDDLCTGARFCEGIIDNPDDGLAALVGRFRSLSICPAKHAGMTRRLEDLVRLVRERRARAVIILVLKFCDPHGFDVPYLTDALNSEGILSHVIEIESPMSSAGQWRTRIEAFIEML